MRATRSSNNLNLTIPIRRNEYGKIVFPFWEQIFGMVLIIIFEIQILVTDSNIRLNENILNISKLEGKISIITKLVITWHYSLFPQVIGMV